MMQLLLLLLLQVFQNANPVNQERIILILSAQRPLKNSNKSKTDQQNIEAVATPKKEFYVYHNYTKYVNQLGDGYTYMIVPYCVEDELFQDLLNISSGVLLPGGSDDFYEKDQDNKIDVNKPTQLLRKMELVYEHATNPKNIEDGFAVNGICLGMEGFMIAGYWSKNKGEEFDKFIHKYNGRLYKTYEDQVKNYLKKYEQNQEKKEQEKFLQNIKHRINISDSIVLLNNYNSDSQNKQIDSAQNRIKSFFTLFKQLKKSKSDMKYFYFFHQKGISLKKLNSLGLQDRFQPIATYKSNQKDYIAIATMKAKSENEKAPIVLLTQFHGEKTIFEENENVQIEKNDDNAKELNTLLINIFRPVDGKEKYISNKDNGLIEQIAQLMNFSFETKIPKKSKLHGPAYVLNHDELNSKTNEIKKLLSQIDFVKEKKNAYRNQQTQRIQSGDVISNQQTNVPKITAF